VLTGKDASPVYDSLQPAERKVLLQIVRDTKSNLPADW
jgi:hypothetical protein